MNAREGLITWVICWVRVEEIEYPLSQKARWLDKLVDELETRRAMEKVLRWGRDVIIDNLML